MSKFENALYVLVAVVLFLAIFSTIYFTYPNTELWLATVFLLTLVGYAVITAMNSINQIRNMKNDE